MQLVEMKDEGSAELLRSKSYADIYRRVGCLLFVLLPLLENGVVCLFTPSERGQARWHVMGGPPHAQPQRPAQPAAHA